MAGKYMTADAIFLSASIPDRQLETYIPDPLAIREAVLALVSVIIQERELVFGGHPAISPLVEHAARSLNAVDNVHIFQSRFFEQNIPPVAKAFKNLHWTPMIPNQREESLQLMREEMIHFKTFRAGVFIGGMDGVEKECEVFKSLYSRDQIFPVASTRGAAWLLWDKGEGCQVPTTRNQLVNNKRYRALFRRLFR